MSSNIHFISFNIINIVSEKPIFKCSLGKNMAETSSVTQVFCNQFKDHIYGEKILYNEMFPKSNLR